MYVSLRAHTIFFFILIGLVSFDIALRQKQISPLALITPKFIWVERKEWLFLDGQHQYQDNFFSSDESILCLY